jgi:O-antigen ligase
VSNRPIFGALSPGYAAEQVGAQTDLGAVDNGYLSISVDMGLLGLLVALVPIGIAATVLWRSLRLGVTPIADLALALSIVSLAVVTLFYDTFYWAQLDLMLFTMGGVLSARLPALKRTRLIVWRTRPAYSSRI